MSRLTWASLPRTFAQACLLLFVFAPVGGGRAADIATLQGHAQGRLALVDGDLPGAQEIWDGVLRRRQEGLHAISLERSCDRADLAAALGRRRSLAPIWVAGGDCATLLWGAFESAAEAEALLASLPDGALPPGARVVQLLPPLSKLMIDAPPPGPAARIVGAVPRVTAPSDPAVQEADLGMAPAAEAEQRIAEPQAVPAPAAPQPEAPQPEAPQPEAPQPEARQLEASQAEARQGEAAQPQAQEPPSSPEPSQPVAQAREAVFEPTEPVSETAPPAARVEPPPAELLPQQPQEKQAASTPSGRAAEQPSAQRPVTTPAAVPEPPRQRRVPEVAPPLPTEPEGLTDSEREERRARAAGYFADGNALWASGDYRSAIQSFETALELHPDNPRILNNLGTAWLKAERPERAVAVLARAVELDPLYSRAFLNLSTALYASERPEDALVSLQRVIDLEPLNLDARYNRAAVLAELRRWTEARAALREGLDIAPGDARLLEFLAQIDQQVAVLSAPSQPAGRPSGTVEACQGIVSDVFRARRAGELFAQGEEATLARDWAAAEEFYLGVLDCDPTSSATANRLGVARLQRGDANAARQAFELANRLDPEHFEARTNACLATYASGDCESATGCLRQLSEDAPNFGPGWRELALMLYRCGRSIEAESAAVRGLEVSPQDSRLRDLLARIEGERIAAPR